MNWKELAAFFVVHTGGHEETSLGALKEVATIQANGINMRNAPPITSTYTNIFEMTFDEEFDITITSTFIVDAFLPDIKLDHREKKYNHEENIGCGAGNTHSLLIVEGVEDIIDKSETAFVYRSG